MIGKALRRKNVLVIAVVMALAGAPAFATILLFENVGLPMSRELQGLQSVQGYGDRVTGASSGGFTGSFAKGNGWTPNVVVEFSAGNDLKTVSTWRDKWDGGDGANYLLDGDTAEPYFYWYRFTPSRGFGVVVNSLDLDAAGNATNRIDWKIFAGSKIGKVLASGSTGRFSGDRTKLDLGMRKPHHGVVILELAHTGGRTSLAVDNLDFDEVPAVPGSGIVEVGHRKQLLVDNHVIAGMSNLKRELGRVTKLNGGKPVLVRDQPWERSCTYYGTALHDGQKFQMWYRASLEPFALGYAESHDGRNWVKPKLGLVEFGGTKQNNILDVDLGLAYAFSCFIDPHETDPAHRYKCCWGHPRKIRACLGHSADGLRWTPYNNGEPVTGRAADTHSQLMWDEDAKVYRLFTRTDYQRFLRAEMEVRGHRGMTNPDLKRNPTDWKLGRHWYFNREPKEYRRRQVYSMSDWMYHGVHFALISGFDYPQDHSEGPRDLQKRHERDVLNFYIATGRDGENWDFQWVYAGQPLVPRGPAGSFDKDIVIPPSNIITHKDRHWIYYSGSNERHGIRRNDEAIGVATLRLDGFVCLAANDRPGTVLTRPFRLTGDKLLVNVQGARFRVDVLNRKGEPIPGFSGDQSTRYRGVDELRLAPTWKNATGLSALRGQVVRLKFHLKNARLYSFHVPK